MPFDVSEVIDDPEMNQEFSIIRATGSWGIGGWRVGESQTIPAVGIVSTLNSKELNQLPEGDRIQGSIAIHTYEPILSGSVVDGGGSTTDKILYKGELYKVVNIFDYDDYGYFKAIGVRERGV